MRVRQPPRVAPDEQVEPLEIGTTPVITDEDLVTLKATVVDADTGVHLPHRVHIAGPDGEYYPPEGHTDIEMSHSNTNNVSFEPDTINDGYDWAMRPDGAFTVRLRARDNIKVRISHGLEYPLETVELSLAESAGQTLIKEFPLKRGINMRQKGWMSADTHVHNLTPLGAIRQMPVEAIDYVNLMFIGRRHPLLRRMFLTGQPDRLSTSDHIVYVSQEVRDANQGHMTLIGMKVPIEPIRVYTGSDTINNLAPLPNEPLNWEVHDMMHAQNGLAYHAHYLFWPGYGSAVGAALKKLDGLEWLRSDISSRGFRTRQKIAVPGFGQRDAGTMWYDMLNCGVRMPLIGGTDKMNAGRVVGGSCRTYVKVAEWSHAGFMAGLRTGETFVTNGPLLELTANGQPIGSELRVGRGPVSIEVDANCFSQVSINHLELIVNGKPVSQQEVAAGEKEARLSQAVEFSESGWLAVRARSDQPNPDNWHRQITAAHSSPIYVTIGDRLPAVKSSAEYMVARLNTTLRWAEHRAIWSNNEARENALEAFEQAKAFYGSALERAE